MYLPNRFSAPSRASRNTVIVGLVVALHVAGLWALQMGLKRPVAEAIVAAELLSEFIAPPALEAAPPPATPLPPTPAVPVSVQPKLRAPRPAPAPLAIADPVPSPNAPSVTTQESSPAPAVENPAAALAPAPAAPALPAPARIELPSSDAAYLNNPKPSYPATSKRLGEQGKVVLRVLISAEGLPQTVELKQSSGFERLDRQAQDAVMRWRFVPGKRNGVSEAMWNLVPIHFVLE